MHDLDRRQFETGFEAYESGEASELGSELYEGAAETGSVLESVFGELPESGFESYEAQESFEAPLSEMMEAQLAAELLEITNEQDLEYFLGNLIRKAAGAVGKVVKTTTGQSLGDILKSVGKKLLPLAGTALGTMIGGPAGGALGGKLASAAGGLFGLELGEMSPEDRDFTVARRFVRLSAEAAKQAASAPQTMNGIDAAKAAVVEAARKHAPGLLSSTAAAQPNAYNNYSAAAPGAISGQTGACRCGSTRKHKGFWFRRGNHIVLAGV